MYISTDDFILEEIRYMGIVRRLPEELREVCPGFHHFISPANWSGLDRGTSLYRAYNRGEYIELSIAGEQRWAMMKSPHAATLIRIYALQRLHDLSKEAANANNPLPPRSINSKTTL